MWVIIVIVGLIFGLFAFSRVGWGLPHRFHSSKIRHPRICGELKVSRGI